MFTICREKQPLSKHLALRSELGFSGAKDKRELKIYLTYRLPNILYQILGFGVLSVELDRDV